MLVSIDDLIKLFRPLQADEVEKANSLIETVISDLKVKAKKVDMDLDELSKDNDYHNVLKSVVCDIVGRALMTSTDQEPMVQSSESALGYSWSGTFLVPGGGLFIKNDELKRLGLLKQRYGVIDFYENPWDRDYLN
ncbi:MAG: phage Gp19/Gp15/Gp42 family protein [Eubacteriales bacterium]|uniref:phage Gp19/Gp15/Gp42 family protein n=1 Tax=Fenollaria sp. TaxID=1965292 RepID=UPI002A762786|nr:phage Gp19/Gp15/Gp42 family protein [Fenollaria sp.]MDD7339791.1 phage Gp19/Gp15/Gp42 family protein [Eubacteriales bacterium]MDY3106313.1 phage Gp19/Gp15/Gp42 family protein [Fenollaria sp.]